MLHMLTVEMSYLARADKLWQPVPNITDVNSQPLLTVLQCFGVQATLRTFHNTDRKRCGVDNGTLNSESCGGWRHIYTWTCLCSGSRPQSSQSVLPV